MTEAMFTIIADEYFKQAGITNRGYKAIIGNENFWYDECLTEADVLDFLSDFTKQTQDAFVQRYRAAAKQNLRIYHGPEGVFRDRWIDYMETYKDIAWWGGITTADYRAAARRERLTVPQAVSVE